MPIDTDNKRIPMSATDAYDRAIRLQAHREEKEHFARLKLQVYGRTEDEIADFFARVDQMALSTLLTRMQSIDLLLETESPR